ncbi:MAG: mechanosensitive ion channel [Propionivibrio sp.]|nr:mechanosensitive ion channel [Propionivibrio sp.]HRC60138.1 mechanosensitive ion channel [Candidatus Propionivibrio aalborgensis]
MKKHVFLVRLLTAVLGLLLLSGALVFAADNESKDAEAKEATLEFNFRPIFVFRSTFANAAPTRRAERALERLDKLTAEQMQEPVELLPFDAKGIAAVAVRIDSLLMFVVAQSDIDPGSKTTLDEAAERVRTSLDEAIAALREQRRPEVLFKGIIFSLVATVLAFALAWGIARTRYWAAARLQVFIEQESRIPGLRLARYGWVFVQRAALLLTGALFLAVAYLWLSYVLERFPVTAPLGRKLGSSLVSLLSLIGDGLVEAIPGMTTALVILFLTKAMNDVMVNIFKAVREGRTELIGIHKETASATQRIASVIVWGFGIAIAYPFIPLSNSDAFKGLSVMFGFMLTLGSAGIVNQLMSGLVLVYSRALSVGDFVDLGQTVGVVSEVGVLATKIVNLRNEEVTVPNAVLIGNSITNYSRLAGKRGAMVSTKTTIGYDTPWRQVHAMLIAAAEATPGLRSTPPPFVYQRGLADFYVEYELFAYMDNPLQRVAVLSTLHANIQDQFNSHGVQIMSPHFVAQPQNNVVVPRENWNAPPAEPE